MSTIWTEHANLTEYIEDIGSYHDIGAHLLTFLITPADHVKNADVHRHTKSSFHM
jgi:hypothetical protein